MRLCWCGRWIKSLGWAAHRAAHYRKGEKPSRKLKAKEERTP